MLGTAHPKETWVTQQARNVVDDFVDAVVNVKFIVRDRDTKYVASFDEVFKSEGAQILRTPFWAPDANACAERFVRTVRSECLDHILVSTQVTSSASFKTMPGTTTANVHIRDCPKRSRHPNHVSHRWRRLLRSPWNSTRDVYVDTTGSEG
jgi:hypothetical protein